MDLRHVNSDTIKLIDWDKVLYEREIQYGDQDDEMSELDSRGIKPSPSVEAESQNVSVKNETTKRVVFDLGNNNNNNNNKSKNEPNLRILSGHRKSAKKPAFAKRVNTNLTRPSTLVTNPPCKGLRSSTTTPNNFRSKKDLIDADEEDKPTSTYLETPEIYGRKYKTVTSVKKPIMQSSISATLMNDFNQNLLLKEKELIIYEATIENTDGSNIKIKSSGDISPVVIHTPPKQPQLPQVSILKHNAVGEVDTPNPQPSPNPPDPNPEQNQPVQNPTHCSFLHTKIQNPNPWNTSLTSLQFIKKLYTFLIFLLIGTGVQLLILGNYEIQFMKTGLEKSFVGYETWIQYITGLLALVIGLLSVFIVVYDKFNLMLSFCTPGAIILLILNIISIASTGIQYADVDNYIDNLVPRKDFDSKDWEVLNYVQLEFNCCGGHQGFQDFKTEQLPKSCCFQYHQPNSTMPNCTKASLETGYLKKTSCSKLVQEYVQLMSFNAYIILGYTTIIIILFLVVGIIYLRILKKIWTYHNTRFAEERENVKNLRK